MNNFGIFLKQMRSTRSLKEMAELLNERSEYISYLEKGKTIPTKEFLTKITELFKLNKEQILQMYKSLSNTIINGENLNIRALVLSLDEKHINTLCLLQGNSDTLDTFITHNFLSSDDVREYFEPIVTEFLEQNINYINEVEKRTGKAYRGEIVLLEYNEKKQINLDIKQKRVLYSDYRVIYDEAIKHPTVMKKAVLLNKAKELNLLSEYISREIYRYNYGNSTSQKIVKSYVHNSKRKYDLIRLFISSYISARCEDNSLKTPKRLYKEYLECLKEKELEQALINKTIEETKEEPFIIVDGVKYDLNHLPYDNEQLKKFDLGGTLPDEINYTYKHKTTE